MPTYAASTSVSSEKSRADIERTLARYGARQFMYGYDETRAIVQFQTEHRQVRFSLPMPDRNAVEFTHTPSKKLVRDAKSWAEAYEQAVRQRWRALHLVITAKLEAVQTGIVTFDAEFMAHIVLPDGSTVGETIVPGIELAYETKSMPALFANFGTKAIES